MALVTWCVTYKFKNAGQWVTSYYYVDANSPEAGKAKAQKMLEDAKVEYEILSIRMVGEG